MNRQELEKALDAAFKEWTKIVPGPCADDYHGPKGDVECAARRESLNCCLDEGHEGYKKLVAFIAERLEAAQ